MTATQKNYKQRFYAINTRSKTRFQDKKLWFIKTLLLIFNLQMTAKSRLLNSMLLSAISKLNRSNTTVLNSGFASAASTFMNSK